MHTSAGDVDGSVEAVLSIVDSYDAQQQCQLEVLHFGIGAVSENDVNMAQMFSGRAFQVHLGRRSVIKGEVCFVPPGSIYGFNVEASKSVQQLAAKHGVPLHLHAVIYKLMDELKDELSSKLPPLTSENILGKLSACTFPERLAPPPEPRCHHLCWSR